jgi:hypothetical protein
LTWSFNETGTYYITTSWSGTSFYAGADSETLTVFVGPESVLQFQAPNYNYILEQTNILYYLFGAASTANNTLRPIQGVNNFLSIPIGTNISFSYNFIVLQTGHPASNYSSQTITTPPHEQQMRIGRNRQIRTVQIPGQTLTVPTNVPDGMGPLTLPPDFNQTINNQFCFLLQNNGSDNFSLNMKALDGYDVANMTQDNQSNMAFVNASGVIKENTWYKITEGISENEITARINDANGTLIGRMTTPSDAVAILVANNVDNAVVFKNLQFQNVNTPTQTPEPNAKVTSNISLFSSYVVVAVVLLVTISAAMLYFKSKRASDKGSGKLLILS